MAAVQKRNDQLVDILRADFVDKGNPAGYWHGHRQIIPTNVSLTIPANFCVTVADFEIEAGGSLEIEAGGVLMAIG